MTSCGDVREWGIFWWRRAVWLEAVLDAVTAGQTDVGRGEGWQACLQRLVAEMLCLENSGERISCAEEGAYQVQSPSSQ